MQLTPLVVCTNRCRACLREWERRDGTAVAAGMVLHGGGSTFSEAEAGQVGRVQNLQARGEGFCGGRVWVPP